MANEKQHGEAVRELAARLMIFNTEMDGAESHFREIIAEEIAPLLDIARKYRELALAGNYEELARCINNELIRWEPK